MDAALSEATIGKFASIVGVENLFLDKGRLEEYGHDKTEDLVYLPDIVLRPGTAQEVSEVLKICNEQKIPVTPRGAGTGLAGGALEGWELSKNAHQALSTLLRSFS